MSIEEWREVLDQIKENRKLLSSWERDFVDSCYGKPLLESDKDIIGEIYYERVIQKIPGSDR